MKELDWGEEGVALDGESAALQVSFRQKVVIWHKVDHPNGNCTSYAAVTMICCLLLGCDLMIVSLESLRFLLVGLRLSCLVWLWLSLLMIFTVLLLCIWKPYLVLSSIFSDANICISCKQTPKFSITLCSRLTYFNIASYASSCIGWEYSRIV